LIFESLVHQQTLFFNQIEQDMSKPNSDADVYAYSQLRIKKYWTIKLTVQLPNTLSSVHELDFLIISPPD